MTINYQIKQLKKQIEKAEADLAKKGGEYNLSSIPAIKEQLRRLRLKNK